VFENGRKIIHHAFDNGITHFDLANNYGPLPGSAEENFGKILKQDFNGNLRDELIISSKAGYHMWEGPYGEWGSRKYLIASCDQSLKRMGLEYVDIFYSHRPDPNTPLEETMMALDHIVRSGKALYAGISNYDAEQAKRAINILKSLGTPCLIHQPKYSMFVRWVEEGLLDVLQENGAGCIAFSPLAQGLLTDRYLKGIPEDSRAAKPTGFLQTTEVTEEKIAKIRQLKRDGANREPIAGTNGFGLVLKDESVTSVLIGASSVEQLSNNLAALNNLIFQRLNWRQSEIF
jgi:L-glyceraldehyde 3-phosphate reductase